MQWPRTVALLVAACFLAGCVRAISKEVRREAVTVENFGQVRQATDAFKGKTVILGGDILETRNRPEGTTVVVLEKSLDWTLRPRLLDVTGGRFMVRFGEYLDPAIFSKGRQITVAGRVVGSETEKVGEVPYNYVILEGRESYLWRESYESTPPWYDRTSVYPYPAWYDPYWGRRPWPR